MTTAVDLVLEPGLATVRPREGRRGGAGSAAGERFRGPDPAATVTAAVRSARCLRTLRRVDLRVVLETSEVTLRVRSAGSAAAGAAPVGTVAPAGPVGGLTVVTGPAGPDGGVLEVGVPAALVAAVMEGLQRRPCWGVVRMELGALVRTAALLTAAGPAVRARPGVVVDVTRAAVTLVEVDTDGVRGARAAPAADVRAALTVAAPVLRRRLAPDAAPDGRRPWLHLAVPPALEAGVRAVCAAALPPGTHVDLLRLRRRGR